MALWPPDLQEGGQACDIVVGHVCLRSPVNQDSWGGCDSSYYSAAHIRHMKLEGKQPSPLFSLEAAPVDRRALTRSSKLSSCLLVVLSSSSMSTAAPHVCSLLARAWVFKRLDQDTVSWVYVLCADQDDKMSFWPCPLKGEWKPGQLSLFQVIIALLLQFRRHPKLSKWKQFQKLCTLAGHIWNF